MDLHPYPCSVIIVSIGRLITVLTNSEGLNTDITCKLCCKPLTIIGCILSNMLWRSLCLHSFIHALTHPLIPFADFG